MTVVPGYWVVTKKRYKASHIFDEAIVFDPNAEILYPWLCFTW